ncbi:MAG TPA: hypothetical protein VJV23_10255, partial [Candidatus Polarisedimenticolia bacterium]|nr:hypothetical protein [Candidatus Polarisedimenticolia bacterium]
AAGQAAFAWAHQRAAAAELAQYLALPPLRAGSTVLALSFEGRKGRVAPLLHAVSYAAIEAGAVDLGNYEAKTDHFQIRFKPLPMPPHALIERAPARIDVRAYAGVIDHLVTWDLRAASGGAVPAAYTESYEIVAESGRAILFESRAARARAAAGP